MLKAYQPQNGGLKGTEVLEGMPVAPESLWIDLLNPTITEREAVKALLGMEMPTRADMEEIEVSSRLYVEDGGVFMTALVLANSDSDRPVADVVTSCSPGKSLSRSATSTPSLSGPLRHGAAARWWP